MDELTKICIKCKADKYLSDYHVRKDKKDGHVNICKECYSHYHKEYYEKAKSHKCEIGKIYHEKNRSKRNKYNRQYHEKNKTRLNKISRLYAANHRNEINEAYNKKRKTDSVFRLNHNVRTAIRISLKGNKAGRHWEDIVGYTLVDLKQHLEKQFQPGMTWENYGQWHIDHIIPLSIFDIRDTKSLGFKKAWALENLRPLWAKQNFKKNAKLFAA
ncbi:MAG: hypothetical protein WC261_08390 [Synergistaceae bacterium]|jgi:hypothetical protein